MLTLKAPIQLHIAQGLTGNAEAFSSRILGNYHLLGAKVAPKELLFLLTATPELPEELGGMTTLVSQQVNVDTRSVTLDVVNNVVNRILMDGSNQFTYQDQVYITTVLNRLGITNVEQFMAQVRQLRTESENTVQLTQLYRRELRQLLERQTAGERMPGLPLPAPEGAEEEPARPDPRVEMSLSILNRLQTSALQQTVHSFQHSWSQAQNHLHRNELRLAEQVRFSSSVALAEIKQKFFENPQLQLHHHLNQYEAGVLLEVPRDEEEVLSQAAVAALLTAVDNTVTEVLNRPQTLQAQWLHLENALWQTAENTLLRFENYHSESRLLPVARERTLEATWNRYNVEAGEYLNLHQHLYPKGSSEARRTSLPTETLLRLTHLTHLDEGDLYLTEGDQTVHITQRQRGTLLRELLSAEMRAYTVPGARLTERERQFYTQSQELDNRRLTERLLLEHESGRVSQPLEQKEITLPRMTVSEVTVPGVVEPMELLSPETEQQAAEALAEEVYRIDQHNRTVLQAVREELQKHEEPPAVMNPDLRRTMQDSLRALEDPMQVIQEIYTQQEALAMEHPTLTPQEEAILNRADPTTRALYERVLLYEKDPEAALALGGVRPSNLGALHAELQQVAQRETAPVLEHLETVHEVERLETETTLEHFRTLLQRRPAPEQLLTAPQAVSIVHKQAPPDVTEELLEQLEQQQTRQVVTTQTNEEIRRQNIHQTELTNVERQMVTQTNEEITQLVNRTLSQQMRTISDQVYRQMEKRLQTERSRRGRL